jgi:hypothetical protein
MGHDAGGDAAPVRVQSVLASSALCRVPGALRGEYPPFGDYPVRST